MTSCAYGMILDDGAVIGQQPYSGSFSIPIGASDVAGNQWWDDGGFTFAWGGPWTIPGGATGYNWQTYTIGSSAGPTLSPMMVNTVIATSGGYTIYENPTQNGFEGGPAYSMIGGSIFTPTLSAYVDCDYPPATIIDPVYRQGDTTHAATHTGIAQYGSFVTQDDMHRNQVYSLSPNPNNGRDILLQQKVADNESMNVEIWNSTGVQVYKGMLNFNGGSARFDMLNKSPGLYLIQITDNSGERYLIKFIINEE